MTDTPVHILLTGSTRGIGAGVRDALLARGARVVGHGRLSGLDVVGADLADPEAADRLWADAVDRLDGRVDVLINNAGVYEAVAETASAVEWRAAWTRTMQINLQAAADLSRSALLHWRERGATGRIVNVSSRAANRGDSPEHWHYGASKAAMLAMSKSMARAYAAERIYAFAVCPGFVETEMATDFLTGESGRRILGEIPLGRAAHVEEVASITTYLALDAPASMTGAVVDINGASYVR